MSEPPAPVVRFERARLRLWRRGLAGRAGWGAVAALVSTPFLWAFNLRELAFALSYGALALLGVAALLRFWPTRRRGDVEVDGQELRVVRGGRARFRVRRDEIEVGLAKSTLHTAGEVELSLSGGRSLELELRTDLEAVALLDALGVGFGQRRAVVRVASDNARLGVGCAAAALLPMLLGLAFEPAGDGAILSWVLVSAIAVWAMVRATRPPTVVVGVDGVEIEGPFRGRFVALDQLWFVTVSAGRCVLVLHDGQRILLGGLGVDRERSLALARRIREAVLAKAGAVETVTALTRRGRSLGEWRAEVGKLLRGRGYRAGAVSHDEVARVLEQAGAPAEARLGAALALAATGADGRARVRLAADRTAEPKLRIALEKTAAAEADEQALEEALRVEETAGG